MVRSICRPILFFLALACAAQTQHVIVLPAGSAVDPANRTATILDAESWKPVGATLVGMEAFQAFTLPNGSKTYVVSKSVTDSVTVLGDLAEGGKHLATIDLPGGITDAALTPDGRRLLIVSLTDPFLTVINTEADRVMARIPLVWPANSVVVNFDASKAFTASPTGSVITSIDIPRNVETARVPLFGDIKPGSQLTFAPNGLLYVVSGDFLYEIDPSSLKTVSAVGLGGRFTDRPRLTFEGTHALLTSPGSLALVGLRQPRPSANLVQPNLGIERLEMVSESAAIGYSPSSRAFYAIEWKPTVTVAPIADLASLGTGPVRLAGSREFPNRRHLFIASGKEVSRFDLRTNRITASYSLESAAGVLAIPGPASTREVANLYLIGPATVDVPATGESLPVVVRALDEEGLPVAGRWLRYYFLYGGYSGGGTTDPFSNCDGYAQSTYKLLRGMGPYAYNGWVGIDWPFRLTTNFRLNPPDSAGYRPGIELVPMDGAGQIITDSETPHPLEVRVFSDYPRARVADAVVNWAITAGGGSLKWQQTTTDSRGIARNAYFGPVAPSGTHPVIEAVAQGAAPASFTMVKWPNGFPPPSFTRLSTEGPLRAGALTPRAFTYRVGRPGVSIQVRTIEGRSSVRCLSVEKVDPIAERFESTSLAPPVSDAGGVVTCHLKAGLIAGPGKLRVYLGGLPAEDIDYIIAPGTRRRLRMAGGEVQWGAPFEELSEPLVALVDDGLGNLLNGERVRWSAGAGSTILSSTTESQRVSYADESRPGAMRTSDGVVTARARQGAEMILPGFNAMVALPAGGYLPDTVAGSWAFAPKWIRVVDGDGQAAATGTGFARPLVVELNIDTNPPLRQVPVTFTTSGGLVLSSKTGRTNDLGHAEITVTAGRRAGTHTVVAMAGGVSVTFRLTVTAQ